jgi:hypothetical protein
MNKAALSFLRILAARQRENISNLTKKKKVTDSTIYPINRIFNNGKNTQSDHYPSPGKTGS